MSKETLSASSKASRFGPRLGKLGIGAVAGISAGVAPRLSALIGASTGGSLERNAFSEAFVIGLVFFALLLGVVVMILEWESKTTPRQTFVTALGVQALLAGAFNSVAISNDAVRLGKQLDEITAQLIKENGIVVKEASLQSPEAERSVSVFDIFDHFLVQTAFAQDLRAETQAEARNQGIGVFRQQRYWVVLATAANMQEATKAKDNELKKYGPLTLQQLGKRLPSASAERRYPIQRRFRRPSS